MSAAGGGGIVSKKLKYKGESSSSKSKSTKKRSRDHGAASSEKVEDDATGTDNSWIFPSTADEINGPCFIVLPVPSPAGAAGARGLSRVRVKKEQDGDVGAEEAAETKPTDLDLDHQDVCCLSWDPIRQRVQAAPLPLADLGLASTTSDAASQLTLSQLAEIVEPTEVEQVWVAGRLSGAEGVVSLRTSSGTFLSAHSSGVLSASTPSRGALECLTPIFHAATATLPPTVSLRAPSGTYLAVSRLTETAKLVPGGGGASAKFELRADVEEGDLATRPSGTRWIFKCQKSFVEKARQQADGGGVGKKMSASGGPGRVLDMGQGLEGELSKEERRALKRARKEGRLNEAILDTRAKKKHDHFC